MKKEQVTKVSVTNSTGGGALLLAINFNETDFASFGDPKSTMIRRDDRRITLEWFHEKTVEHGTRLRNFTLNRGKHICVIQTDYLNLVGVVKSRAVPVDYELIENGLTFLLPEHFFNFAPTPPVVPVPVPEPEPEVIKDDPIIEIKLERPIPQTAGRVDDAELVKIGVEEIIANGGTVEIIDGKCIIKMLVEIS